ncbi:MAG: hypothetical protein K8S55_02885 [Phycisphaerae bacterium]|nr:hypothetical protein [Phycisphaerae bacterium]
MQITLTESLRRLQKGLPAQSVTGAIVPQSPDIPNHGDILVVHCIASPKMDMQLTTDVPQAIVNRAREICYAISLAIACTTEAKQSVGLVVNVSYDYGDEVELLYRTAIATANLQSLREEAGIGLFLQRLQYETSHRDNVLEMLAGGMISGEADDHER